MRMALAAGLFGASALAGQQMRPPIPPDRSVQWTEGQYGPPRDVDVDSIANETGGLNRQHVRTHGRINPHSRSQYFVLSDGAPQVLVILVESLDPTDVLRLMGSRVEVRGVVRKIRPKQYMNGVDLDKIEDPDLPVLPAPSLDLPQVSLTLFSVSDDEEPAGTGEARGPGPAPTPISQLKDAPERYLGKPVRVLGQFRGRNLFDDLPKETQRGPNDWVIRDARGGAAWVVDKKPAGKGFALDPGYKGDTTRWLDVLAKPEVVSGVVYLRGASLKLTTAPKPAAQ